MVETKEAFRAKVLVLCRNYYSQVWHETLNQARFKASSILRKPESEYYPLAIRASSPSNLSTNTAPKVAEASKDSLVEVLTSSDKPSKVTEHPGATEKEKNANQGVAPDATKPSAAIQDPPPRKKFPTRWRLSWLLFPSLPRLILQARAPRAQKQRPLNLTKPLPKERL